MSEILNTVDRYSEDEAKAAIETTKAELKLPFISAPASIQEIINLTSNVQNLRGIPPVDLLEYAVVLTNYSAYLAQQENRYKTYINWSEANLKQIVGERLIDAPGYGFNEKDIYIRANVSMAKILDGKKSVAQLKLDTIFMLSHKLHSLAESLKNLAYEKSRSMRDINK